MRQGPFQAGGLRGVFAGVPQKLRQGVGQRRVLPDHVGEVPQFAVAAGGQPGAVVEQTHELVRVVGLHGVVVVESQAPDAVSEGDEVPPVDRAPRLQGLRAFVDGARQGGIFEILDIDVRRAVGLGLQLRDKVFADATAQIAKVAVAGTQRKGTRGACLPRPPMGEVRLW